MQLWCAPHRPDREQRLRDARTEAALEIEALKRSKQEDFAAFESSVLGSLDARVEEYARETAAELGEIERVASVHRNKVVQLLLATVTAVQPTMHRNAVMRQQHQQEQQGQE